ncbi:MAG: VWA domain-containing protein [Acidobacteriota bacterium]
MFFARALVLAWIVAASLWVGTPSASAQDTDPLVGACRLPADLASRLLRGEVALGDLPVAARFHVDQAILLDEGRLRATVEGTMGAEPLAQRTEVLLCVFLLLDVDGEAMLAHAQRLDLDDFAGVESLRYVVRDDLPEGTRQMTFVVHEATSGLWGAMPLETPGDPIPGPGFTARRLAEHEGSWYELDYAAGAPPTARGPSTAGGATGDVASANGSASGGATAGSDGRRRPARRAAAPSASASAKILRLVPPTERPASGRTRIETLVSSTAIDKVVFELDGQVVGEDGRIPFRARLPLDDPPRQQTVRAIAYDSLGEIMGDDTLVLNADDTPLRVRIVGFEGEAAAGEVTVTAAVDVPADSRLDRVEFFLNETLLETRREPPYRLSIETPNVGPADYVRVAATLADGSTIDDVLLLATPGEIEEVDVNLVELHVVVTDRDGQVVDDLAKGDFRITLGGDRREIQSFAYADDVPLMLGLMVDSSGSMELLMHDTRRAAAKFLGRTLLPQDQAFLVDFDLQPRLLQSPTGDLAGLIGALGELQAAGRTAMYDAVMFSLLQYGEVPGRRALVVLSDGDDIDSRFGPKRCAEQAQAIGAPVYVIGLGELDVFRRTYDKPALRRITEDTGGRLYFVDSFAELDAAYAEINAELRSQYTLSFYVDEDLTEADRERLEVEVPRGLQARAVVGSGTAFGSL